MLLIYLGNFAKKHQSSPFFLAMIQLDSFLNHETIAAAARARENPGFFLIHRNAFCGFGSKRTPEKKKKSKKNVTPFLIFINHSR